jgi:hypothetical protein
MTNDDLECMRSAADMLRRNGIAAVLSELAWLQAEVDMTKLLAEPTRTDKSGVR